MTKLYAYALAALVAVIGIGGLAWWGQQGHQAAREAQEKTKVVQSQLDTAAESLRLVKRAAELERAVTKRRADVALAQQKAATRRAKELNDAFKAAPDWSSQSLPDGVYDALTRPDGGEAAASPVPAAGVPSPPADRTHQPSPR